MRRHFYSTQLSKGAGLISETISLLSIYEPDTTKESLLKQVLDTNHLSTSTETRAKDIVNIVFFKRFMEHNRMVPIWLRLAREKGMMVSDLSQLFFIYAARENTVLYEFTTDVLNPLKSQGATSVGRNDFLSYTRDVVSREDADWSETMQKKNAGYIRSTLIDFGLIDEHNEIMPFVANDFTVLYLMHELHFEGLSDMAIWEHEDWGLFNMDKYEALQRIMNLSLKGGFIAQSSGDLLTISWKYNSMEELINATL